LFEERMRHNELFPSPTGFWKNCRDSKNPWSNFVDELFIIVDSVLKTGCHNYPRIIDEEGFLILEYTVVVSQGEKQSMLFRY
jgi:hypothetical protein